MDIIRGRRSIRLKGYDYHQPGSYFITICTHTRVNVFGDITNDTMILNAIGNMVSEIWQQIPDRYSGVDIDSFVVMPNHIHGIVVIDGNGRPQRVAPTLSLPDIVHRFKSITTRRYADGVEKLDWPPFAGRLWQRNYYEHIVRDDTELNIIREYISCNPANWEKDEEYTP